MSAMPRTGFWTAERTDRDCTRSGNFTAGEGARQRCVRIARQRCVRIARQRCVRIARQANGRGPSARSAEDADLEPGDAIPRSVAGRAYGGGDPAGGIRRAAAQSQHDGVRVQVNDRGQADGILIRTPNERWVVIDAGANDAQADAMATEWNVDRVALAVVSHRHWDHLGGLDEIIDDFPVDRLLMNMADCPDRVGDDRVRQVAARRNVATLAVGGSAIEIDGVRFVVLPPDPETDRCPEEENNNSIVVSMEFGEFSMLFTGDSETEQREWLMRHHASLLDMDVLKASHHGAENGADGSVGARSWLETVSSEDVVISAGRDNDYGHLHDAAMDVYETPGHGNVHCAHR